MAELKIKADSGGGTVSLKGPSTTTSNAAVQLTLPVDDGSADQYLKTDGSGALSWGTVAQQTNASNLSSGTLPAARIADDSITEAKLDIHAAPSGTDKFLGYTSNGMEWAAVTAPTGWEKVFRSTGLSGDQDIENATLFDGTYNQIMICLERGVPSADDVDIGVRFKIDGSGYVSDADYKYHGKQGKSSSATENTMQSDGNNELYILTGCGNAAGEWYSVKLHISNFSNATDFKMLAWECVSCSHNSVMAHSYGGGGLRSLTNSLDGIRLFGASGGNLGSTIISGYGLKL